MRTDVECFCDGNGDVPCWAGCDDGWVQADCGDDLCVGNDCIHGLPHVRCEICLGKGWIRCPAHDDGGEE